MPAAFTSPPHVRRPFPTPLRSVDTEAVATEPAEVDVKAETAATEPAEVEGKAEAVATQPAEVDATAEVAATEPAEVGASEREQAQAEAGAGATEHVKAKTGTAKQLIKQQSSKSKLNQLMQSLTGRPLRKGDLQYTPLGDGTTAEDGSAVKEVALKLPAGWRDGLLFQGTGATLQEAENTAAVAAIRALGNFKKISWKSHQNTTNTKPFAEFLGRSLTRNEVVEFDVGATDDEIGGLLYVLAYMGNDKDFKGRVSAQLKYKKPSQLKNQKTTKKGVYVVRIRQDSKRLKGLKESASQVEADTEPARLAASIMKNLGSGGYMKLQVRGAKAAAKAAVALSAVEDFSFTSKFRGKLGIEVSVASS